MKQPDGPIGTVGQVLATRGMGVLDLNLLSVRRLVELLVKVIVLRLKIVVLAKKAQARFITRLVCRIKDGGVLQQRGGAIEC